MTARLRNQDGVALPVAITVLAIMLTLVGVAVSYSVHGLNRSNVDRSSARSLAAADAGLDVAVYRMNKTIVGGEVTSLVGFLNNTILTAGCLNLSVAGLVQVGTGGWCPTSSAAGESVDGEFGGERFKYYTELRLDVNVSGDLRDLAGSLLTRRVVAIGTDNGSFAPNHVSRVMGTYSLDLGHALELDSLLSLFSLKRYVQCPSDGWTESNPAAGCPS